MARNNLVSYKGVSVDIGTISYDMTVESLKELKELFFLEGCYSPIIRWCIATESQWPRPHRILFSFWKANPCRAFNPQHLISEQDFESIKDYMVLTHFKPQESDFSHAWIGYGLKQAGFPFRENESIAKTCGHDGKVTTLFQYTYLSACSIRLQPLLTMYQQETPTSIQVWSTLTVPFTDSAGRLTGLATSAVYSK